MVTDLLLNPVNHVNWFTVENSPKNEYLVFVTETFLVAHIMFYSMLKRYHSLTLHP